jgi:hypothetical protein
VRGRAQGARPVLAHDTDQITLGHPEHPPPSRDRISTVNQDPDRLQAGGPQVVEDRGANAGRIHDQPRGLAVLALNRAMHSRESADCEFRSSHNVAEDLLHFGVWRSQGNPLCVDDVVGWQDLIAVPVTVAPLRSQPRDLRRANEPAARVIPLALSGKRWFRAGVTPAQLP